MAQVLWQPLKQGGQGPATKPEGENPSGAYGPLREHRDVLDHPIREGGLGGGHHEVRSRRRGRAGRGREGRERL